MLGVEESFANAKVFHRLKIPIVRAYIFIWVDVPENKNPPRATRMNEVVLQTSRCKETNLERR